jgi:hypothetical protein
VNLYNPHGVDNTPLYNADGTPMVDEDGEQMFGWVDDPNDDTDANDGFVTLSTADFCDDAQSPFGAITADYNAYF